MSKPAIEPCTTWSRRKRHLSANLAPDRHAPRHPGRTGRTLCGEGAFDQERRQYELSRWSNRTVTVADLPPCKRCERARASAEERSDDKSKIGT